MILDPGSFTLALVKANILMKESAEKLWRDFYEKFF